jgi:pimeloyl-ACP methyl ester carboxylesterase
MVLVPTCGYLTVPERRDVPRARSIRIFVVRLEPPGGIEHPDPMVAVGEVLGGRIEYGGLAILAGRTGREIYIVDRRGTGLSEPSLDCPEIAAASPRTLALPSGDPEGQAILVEAARACRDRLLGAGIDVSAYGLRESALDIEALRVALGFSPWNVIAFGSASRLALEVARQAPDGVRTVVLDSPVLPQGPDPMFATAATASAIEQVGVACAAALGCDAEPAFTVNVARAVRALDAQPISIETTSETDGRPVTILLDGTRLAKGARNQLAAAGGSELDELIDTMAATAADGQVAATDLVIRALARDDAMCIGYVPDCRRVVHGSLLATTCAEVLPFVDRDAALAAGGDVPGMAGLFVTNPFFGACDAWDVPPDPGVAEPIETKIPILVMVGRFDPYSGPSTDLVSAAGLRDAVILEVPAHSYNVFGFNECPRQVRREWLDQPDHVPDASCFAELRTVDLSR